MKNKPWYKKWWAIGIFVFLGLIILGNLIDSGDGEEEAGITQSTSEVYQEPILEMETQQLLEEFNSLSEIQAEEKIRDLKGKRIKTSLYVSKLDQASLSSQYVAMEMYEYPYHLMPAVKAFFPAGEKEKLLKVNIGDTIIFSGEFVTYNKGGLTSYIEFTNSKLIEVKSVE